MPLLKGKKNVGKNIATEMNAGKPRKQAIAIAMNEAKEEKKEKNMPKVDQYGKPIKKIKV